MSAPDLDPIGLVLAEVRDMGPTTVAEIAAGTGLGERAIRRYLHELEATGLVESSDYQRRGRGRVYLETEAPA